MSEFLNLVRSAERALLPQGSAWTLQEGGLFDRLLEALAENNARVVAFLSLLKTSQDAMQSAFFEELCAEYGIYPLEKEERTRRLLAGLTSRPGEAGDRNILRKALVRAGFKDLFVYTYDHRDVIDVYSDYERVGVPQQAKLRPGYIHSAFLVAGEEYSGGRGGMICCGFEAAVAGNSEMRAGFAYNRFKKVRYQKEDWRVIRRIVAHYRPLHAVGLLIIEGENK